MKRSRSGQAGFAGSCRSTRKYSAASNSTSLSEPPGCPLPAAPIILMISTRMRILLRVGELQRVGALEPQIVLDERIRIEDQLQPPPHRKRKVLVALRAHFQVLLDVLLVDDLAATVALDPQPFHARLALLGRELRCRNA